MFRRYDADVGPNAADWLACHEAMRIELVEKYHRRERIRPARLTLHATIHVVVENQIAMGEVVVIEMMARLRAEGLTRHEPKSSVRLMDWRL